MALAPVSLDDKYTAQNGRIFLTGTQALVRLPLVQRRRDVAAGLDTAGYISGYRGSPLGGYDQQLWQARRHLDEHHVVFQPGVNEDLAATAVWGTQQAGLFGDARYDGVFSIWYGKGPGVDRSGDPFKHGNLAGSARHGGVLALAGDDHMCKSSTTAHQSEFNFIDAMFPVIVPAGVQEFLDLGLYGFALSRFSGLWVAFKAIGETVDSAATIDIDPARIRIVLPEEFELPPGGLNIRWPDTPLEQEERLHRFKLPAAVAFARANRLDRIAIASPRRRFGIVTVGKSYLDVRQALDDLGLTPARCAEIGLSVYKVAMAWPLEPEGLRAFAEGLEEILVVEEKRALLEWQIKDILYGLPADRRPRVIGKRDEAGREIFRSHAELTPTEIAAAIAERLKPIHDDPAIDERLGRLKGLIARAAGNQPSLVRTPYFCSGCPHNSSTRVPEGSRALAGIGCHFMAQWMDRDTATYTHMGGEGANWAGQYRFVKTPHVFQNIGDGTYYHSGLLAVRAAVASGANITYKVLYNDAVAMTGGQHVDGPLDPARVTRQLAAEGVGRIVVVTDEPEKYPADAGFAPGVKVEHRSRLDAVQRELREVPGVTAIVYDQTCAAEKRRRRKRGAFPDPQKRVFINEAVCEGCGDCGRTSNCVSVVPVETEFGRKRAIDQSSCNKDFSCLEGFCPSFVTVLGGRPRRRAGTGDADAAPPGDLPLPALPSTAEPYGMLIDGVGGTGVITISAVLAMAAHLDGKAATVMDMTGLAQKGGAVWSHLRVADRTEDLHAVRIAAGGARLLLGCDLVTSAQAQTLACLGHGASHAVVNDHATFTGDFTRNPDIAFPEEELRTRIEGAVGPGAASFIDATRLATALMGDSIAANMFMTGYAFQKGLIPISLEAIDRALELNAVAVEANKRAFAWGRAAAADPAAVERTAFPPSATVTPIRRGRTLDEIVAIRSEELVRYQGRRLARRYEALVRRVEAAEAEKARGQTGLAAAVARYYFKLLAYKDEYEVARLYADPEFQRRLEGAFEGDYRVEFNLAPPLLARTDPNTGHPRKMRFGPSMMRAFKVLARLRFLRGTPLDPFGRTAERRTERQLIRDYEATVEELIAALSPENHALAVDIASIPEQIRGYGHVKAEHLARARQREEDLLAAFHRPGAGRVAAE